MTLPVGPIGGVRPGATDIVAVVHLRLAPIAVILGGDEAAQLTRSIQPDEDLAEDPLVAGGFAAGLDRLDRDIGDGPGDVRRRKRAAIESLRGRE